MPENDNYYNQRGTAIGELNRRLRDEYQIRGVQSDEFNNEVDEFNQREAASSTYNPFRISTNEHDSYQRTREEVKRLKGTSSNTYLLDLRRKFQNLKRESGGLSASQLRTSISPQRGNAGNVFTSQKIS